MKTKNVLAAIGAALALLSTTITPILADLADENSKNATIPVEITGTTSAVISVQKKENGIAKDHLTKTIYLDDVIVLDQPDVGNYSYIFRQVTTENIGIKYDESIYFVDVEVMIDEEGIFSSHYQVYDSEGKKIEKIVFKNYAGASDPTPTPTATPTPASTPDPSDPLNTANIISAEHHVVMSVMSLGFIVVVIALLYRNNRKDDR